MPEYFYQTYRPRGHAEVIGQESNYDRIIERLFHLCANIGVNPDIAFFDMEPPAKAAPQSGYTSDWMRVSMQVQTDVSKVAIGLRERLRVFSQLDSSAEFTAEMRGVFRESFGMKKAGKSSREPNALLVLLDRSIDPVGPLLHDLFYESLVHDAVPLSPFGELELAYQNPQGEKKVKQTPLADPADPIWSYCKHMHLADFLTWINDAFSAFKEEFPEFFPSASGDEASPDLKSRMERMTEYAERSAQFSKHLHLHSLLTAAFNDRNLRDVCELEALMVSGRDIWDESVEPQDVLASVSGLLGKVTLSDEDKMRLLLIYYVALGSAASDNDDGGGARGIEFQGLRQQAFPQGVPANYAAVLKQLESHNMQIHLDMKVQKTGMGAKKKVTYGYGKARRRYSTEPSGDEYNPQQPPKPGASSSTPKRGLLDRLGERLGGGPDVEVSDRDSLSRFEPTLYWLMKDLAKGRDNPHLAYWCGLNADEGTPTRETVLIEDGILKGYMQDRLNARLMGVEATGNGRRESYEHAPMPRMTNTFMQGGHDDPEELLSRVDDGIYATSFGGGQVDIVSGKFVFACTEAYKVEKGKVVAPIKGAPRTAIPSMARAASSTSFSSAISNA